MYQTKGDACTLTGPQVLPGNVEDIPPRLFISSPQESGGLKRPPHWCQTGCSLSKCLLNIYCVLGTVLGPERWQ